MAVDNDWLVDDSEDDGEFNQLLQDIPRPSKATHPAVVGNLTASDVIQTDFFSHNQPRTPERGRKSPDGSLFTPPARRMDSTISHFTDAPSTSGAPPVAPPRPRPRPRVVMKKAAPSNHDADVAGTSFSHISDPPISATRRTNDSIQPATATSFGFSEVDDMYSSFGIAERAKMRSRKPQTARKPIYETQDIIELTSDEDEDELALKPTKRQKKQPSPAPKPKAQTKPRPKPTLKVKAPAVLPSDSPLSRADRDPPAPPPQHVSSQPPTSTLPTIPPSTPPQARELTPLSSPPVTTRKRKRIQPLIAEDEEEMGIIGANPTRVSPPTTMPPPTMPPPFFASSSSSVPTDSGIDIPPVESLSGRGKKAISGKKGTQRKTQNKGKRGKKAEITGVVDDAVEDSAQEPCTPAVCHNSRLADESHSPVAKNATQTEKAKGKRTLTKTGKAGAVDSCEEEDELIPPPKFNAIRTPPAGEGEGQRSKENLRLHEFDSPQRNPPPERSSTSGPRVRDSSVKPKLTPMSELIRRVNSQPSSPFPNAARTYSPFLKSSRTMLSKIAPLHPNRRSPPPPLPRPPPPKKSKKQLEMEERIEEELAETIEGWSCLTDEERKALRKARIDAELGYE